jgi:hypothetical protein
MALASTASRLIESPRGRLHRAPAKGPCLFFLSAQLHKTEWENHPKSAHRFEGRLVIYNPFYGGYLIDFLDKRDNFVANALLTAINLDNEYSLYHLRTDQQRPMMDGEYYVELVDETPQKHPFDRHPCPSRGDSLIFMPLDGIGKSFRFKMLSRF